MVQLQLFNSYSDKSVKRRFGNVITASVKFRGALEVDTVKGCSLGMAAYPHGGCYGECYAYKIANRRGFDFRTSINRQFMGREHRGTIIKFMNTVPGSWYRIGTMGDPCYDWDHSIAIINALWHTHKIPVVVTKHWVALTDAQIEKMCRLQIVVNTSMSGLDTDDELYHRLRQLERLRSAGLCSVARVVTCKFGYSAWAKVCNEKQDHLLSLKPIIDNPLRATQSNPRVASREIILTRRNDCMGGKMVSLHNASPYLGRCAGCPDQCGVDVASILKAKGGYDYETEERDGASRALFSEG